MGDLPGSGMLQDVLAYPGGNFTSYLIYLGPSVVPLERGRLRWTIRVDRPEDGDPLWKVVGPKAEWQFLDVVGARQNIVVDRDRS